MTINEIWWWWMFIESSPCEGKIYRKTIYFSSCCSKAKQSNKRNEIYPLLACMHVSIISIFFILFL